MAAKRMFSKSITNSSLFLMMPQSSQNLYFHLGMNADDDGFCEHFTIMRMTESKPDDLKILQAKRFVEVFDDRVLIILDWKENNLIRSDRYTPSKYLEIYKDELKQLNSGIPVVIPTVATGKDRLGKIRLDQDSIDIEQFEKEDAEYYKISDGFEQFWNLYDKKIEREKCFKKWKKIKPDTYSIILHHVSAYVKSTPDKQYRKNPETYLNNKCWNDEIVSRDNKPSVNDTLKHFEEMEKTL